jgi:hypothetical protein
LARDHEIFVRPDHPAGCFAVPFCNPRVACGICRLVDSTPSQPAFSQTRRRISGACSPMPAVKNEGIKPAESGG